MQLQGVWGICFFVFHKFQGLINMMAMLYNGLTTSTHFNYYTGLLETSKTHFCGRAAAAVRGLAKRHFVTHFYLPTRVPHLAASGHVLLLRLGHFGQFCMRLYTHNMKARAAASPSSEGLSCVQFVARDVIGLLRCWHLQSPMARLHLTCAFCPCLRVAVKSVRHPPGRAGYGAEF